MQFKNLPLWHLNCIAFSYVTHTCYYGDEVKETGVAVSYNKHDRNDKYTKLLLTEHEEMTLLEKRVRWC